MYALFDHFLTSLEPKITADLPKLHANLQVLKVPKSTTLIEVGQIAKGLYFINKGILRLYWDIDGDYKTLYIFMEGLFSTALKSMITGEPSDQGIETIEDCELLYWDKEKLNELYRTVPLLNSVSRKINEQRLIEAQNLLKAHITLKHEERFEWMMENRPELFLRVPQKIVASFLGMTPVSMSRIKARFY